VVLRSVKRRIVVLQQQADEGLAHQKPFLQPG
jgi:hypothetical protein